MAAPSTERAIFMISPIFPRGGRVGRPGATEERRHARSRPHSPSHRRDGMDGERRKPTGRICYTAETVAVTSSAAAVGPPVPQSGATAALKRLTAFMAACGGQGRG